MKRQYTPAPLHRAAAAPNRLLQRIANGHRHGCRSEPEHDAASAAGVLQNGGGAVYLRNDRDEEREKHGSSCERQREYGHVVEGGGDVRAENRGGNFDYAWEIRGHTQHTLL